MNRKQEKLKNAYQFVDLLNWIIFEKSLDFDPSTKSLNGPDLDK